MNSSFYPSHFPAGQEVEPLDQPVPNDTSVSDANEPSPTANDDPGADDDLPASESFDPGDPATPTPTDHFVPSSALNDPQPWTTQTPAPSSTLVSTPGLPVISTSVISSTGTLQSTPTAVPVQGGSLLTRSPSNRKYIIGGAVGGGVSVLILLALLLFCCRKRRGKNDLERSEGQPGHGQFACCDHETSNKSGGRSQVEQKTPPKPFILKSGAAASTPKERSQNRNVSLNRRDSAESQKSAGSDTSTDTVCSSYSEDSQRSTRRSQKRPPPLKLTSLVTTVINGPQDNPRRKVDRSSPPGPYEIPTIVVNPPQPTTPDRMGRR